MNLKTPSTPPRLERPEFMIEVNAPSKEHVIERPLAVWEQAYQNSVIRKSIILLALIGLWQSYALWVNNPLTFPTFTATTSALYEALFQGELSVQCLYSLRLLLTGYGLGILFAGAFTLLAIMSRLGADLLETLTAMFSPLPAIAILPVALLWFGLGEKSLIFVLVNSIVWPIALNVHTGFKSVSPTLKMVGKNYGLGNLRFVFKILVPAAFPSILTGLKVGWAFGWRTLIASELVFGVSSRTGGLGWFIYENKNELNIPAVFAGLLTVILIGLIVENLIFRHIEAKTIQKWGM